MIQSLTAAVNLDKTDYSSHEAQVLQQHFRGLWSIQLRSLNQRFFELSCVLPDSISVSALSSVWELPLRKLLQRQLLRGRVEFRLNYEPWNYERQQPSGKNEPQALAANLVEGEIQELLRLQQQAQNKGLLLQAPSSLQLLQHLQSLSSAHTADESDAAAKPQKLPAEVLETCHRAILEFCEEACCQLIAKRQLEGGEIYRELLSLHATFVSQCNKAEGYEQQISTYYHKQLQDKYLQFRETVQELQHSTKQEASTETSPEQSPEQVMGTGRLLAELSLLLAKGDLREELCRLKIHAQRFLDLLNCSAQEEQGKEPCGKEIDFLLQEMNREANTLGSKSPIVELQQIAVKLKVIIEQMREQAKNIL